MPHWIQHPDTLATWWDRKPTRIGMDTEFIREGTFWPELALVQIAIEDEILLVDPLVPGMTDALGLWLAAPNVIKIMHSASEDLIAFKYACGVLPRPLFDTQIGAALTGLGGGMGYQSWCGSCQCGIGKRRNTLRLDAPTTHASATRLRG